jgi:DNA-binding response OmpR family regulator
VGPTILVIEDETKLRQSVLEYLGREGFTTLGAGDGEAGLRLAREHSPDLILLDLMLPSLPGLEVLRRLRGDSRVPVIVITARAEEADRVVGLELGADDYVSKPFSLRELTARIRAVLRRAGGGGEEPPERIQHGPVVIDFDRRSVEVQGRSIELTPTEFAILGVLIRHPGKVFSRLQLLEAAFGYAYEGYERSVDTHVSNLRRKIEVDPSVPRFVVTVHGVGYKLAGPAGDST